MKIRIDDLDLSLQTRAGTDVDTVNNYAEAMADGAQFPEVTVFTDGTHYWLADGFHRVMAARQNGRATVAADVRNGTEDDAVVFGGTANNRQGKRPTRADVQHFLMMVWERREAIFGGTPTGGNLAERCGVSNRTGQDFVRARLAEMQSAPSRPTRQIAELSRTPANSLPSRPTRQIAELKAPEMPTRLVGANGKTYPIRPERAAKCEIAAPERPKRGKSSEIEDWPRDRYGVQIPEEILGAFADGTPRDQFEGMLRSAERLLRGAMEAGEPSMARLGQKELLELQNVVRAAKFAKPHCVCRMCQGTGCRACGMSGFQTEAQYEANPREFKAR